MLYSEGVRKGRLTLARMVEVLATAPARIAGMYPRKGVLAVGSDADVVIFDLGSPSRDTLEEMLAVSRALARPIAMFIDQSDDQMIAAAIESVAWTNSAGMILGRM